MTYLGEIVISSRDAQRYQELYLLRYRGIRLWHAWVQQQLYKGFIVSASGNRRFVTGRKDDQQTLRQMLSHEPQNNTTFITNLAALRLWNDPTNRRPDNSLRVEPLHQVHDALCGQFRVEDTEFACRKLREWFNNPLNIAGVEVNIPFDGTYGKTWGGEGERFKI
jgi:DNA polymerase I-like protein with 3'-5' exonuclease and polymerase domains